jgi:hypothetical protein
MPSPITQQRGALRIRSCKRSKLMLMLQWRWRLGCNYSLSQLLDMKLSKWNQLRHPLQRI